MKTVRKSSFWAAWVRCFVRGLHALIALMVAGLFTQVAVWATIAIISKFMAGNGQLAESIADTWLPIGCFVLIGLPLFGLLFSGAYSPAETSKVADETEQDVMK